VYNTVEEVIRCVVQEGQLCLLSLRGRGRQRQVFI